MAMAARSRVCVADLPTHSPVATRADRRDRRRRGAAVGSGGRSRFDTGAASARARARRGQRAQLSAAVVHGAPDAAVGLPQPWTGLALVLLLQGGVARWRLATGGVSRLVATASCVAVLGLLYVDLVEDARRMRWQTDIVRRAQLQLRYHLSTRDVSAPEVDDAHVVVISAWLHSRGARTEHAPRLFGGRRPASFHTLTYGQRACLLRRTSASSFELDAVGVPFMTDIDERSFRRVSQALEVGAPVDVGLFEASVLRARGEGEVDALRFDFDRPLEDRSLIFVTSTSTGLRRLELPPVGGFCARAVASDARANRDERGRRERGRRERGRREIGRRERGRREIGRREIGRRERGRRERGRREIGRRIDSSGDRW